MALAAAGSASEAAQVSAVHILEVVYVFHTKPNLFGCFYRNSLLNSHVFELKNAFAEMRILIPSEAASEAAIASRYRLLEVIFEIYA